MYTYDVSRMPRYTLFSLYHYITSTCQSLYSQYAQALYSVLVWYRLSSKSNKSGTVNLTNYFFIFMNQDGPRSLTLSTIIMTSFCHIYIAHPRSTNRVTILRHTSTNRVTILRPTHNNNNTLPSVFFTFTQIYFVWFNLLQIFAKVLCFRYPLHPLNATDIDVVGIQDLSFLFLVV